MYGAIIRIKEIDSNKGMRGTALKFKAVPVPETKKASYV